MYTGSCYPTNIQTMFTRQYLLAGNGIYADRVLTTRFINVQVLKNISFKVVYTEPIYEASWYMQVLSV